MHAAPPLASASWRIEPVVISPPIDVAEFVRNKKSLLITVVLN
jgi:hypothetical protein